MKIEDVLKLLVVISVLGASVFGAVTYFTPKAETAEVRTEAHEAVQVVHKRIADVRQFAGRTQKQLDTFQVDMQISDNKRQLRQIEIEEASPGVTRHMRDVFRKQKQDIRDEIEMLEHKKELIKGGGG